MNAPKQTKVITVIVALLVAAAGGWAIFRFGPKPVEASLAPLISQASQPAPVTQAETLVVTPNPYPALLGFSQEAMQAGEVAEPFQKYVEYLEKLYVRRGYDLGNGQDPQSKRENRQPTNKIYWRENSDNFILICAVGMDP